MKLNHFFMLAVMVVIAISSTSCSQYAPNTKNGAVIGSLLGAGAGAIIGHQSGRGLEGAAIGAVAGGAGGALIGSARDDRERQYYNQQRYQQQQQNGHAPQPPHNSGQYYQHPQRQPRSYY